MQPVNEKMNKPSKYNYHIESYNFHLPEGLIAQEPSAERDGSKLLVYWRDSGKIEHLLFREIIDILPNNSQLVANNSKVQFARLSGTKNSGGKVEFLLLTPLTFLLSQQYPAKLKNEYIVDGLIKTSGRIKKGMSFGFGQTAQGTVVEVKEFGQVKVRLQWAGDVTKLLDEFGQIPLPPYIKRESDEHDADRYQTIYAKENCLGSIAAPTAGLHFTPLLHQKLVSMGHTWEEVTLFVGYGTFSPIRSEDIRDHQLHSEYIEVSEAVSRQLSKAKQSGQPIIAVGTTTLRALESAAQKTGAVTPFRGWSDIYITPGCRFHVTERILTNFHLPKSSLFVLVSALVGRETILDLYNEAIAKKYRFYSYGDAMLIL